MLNSIGVTLVKLGQHSEAEVVLDEALELHSANGNILMQAHAETSLGEIYEARGEAERARDHYARSIALRDQSGDRPGMGWSLYRLARVAARSGATHEANELGRRAYLIADECGDSELQAACAVIAENNR
jgi:tetratricopeptide (TPR) repeat protein